VVGPTTALQLELELSKALSALEYPNCQSKPYQCHGSRFGHDGYRGDDQVWLAGGGRGGARAKQVAHGLVSRKHPKTRLVAIYYVRNQSWRQPQAVSVCSAGSAWEIEGSQILVGGVIDKGILQAIETDAVGGRSSGGAGAFNPCIILQQADAERSCRDCVVNRVIVRRGSQLQGNRLDRPLAHSKLRVEGVSRTGQVELQYSLKFAIGQTAGRNRQSTATTVIVVRQVPGGPGGDKCIRKGIGRVGRRPRDRKRLRAAGQGSRNQQYLRTPKHHIVCVINLDTGPVQSNSILAMVTQAETPQQRFIQQVLFDCGPSTANISGNKIHL